MNLHCLYGGLRIVFRIAVIGLDGGYGSRGRVGTACGTYLLYEFYIFIHIPLYLLLLSITSTKSSLTPKRACMMTMRKKDTCTPYYKTLQDDRQNQITVVITALSSLVLRMCSHRRTSTINKTTGGTGAARLACNLF